MCKFLDTGLSNSFVFFFFLFDSKHKVNRSKNNEVGLHQTTKLCTAKKNIKK